MQKKSTKQKAFSLIELSTVMIIVGVLVAGIMSGKRMINQAKLKSAQALTKSAAINSIPDLALWLETTLDESITGAATGNNLSNNDLISSWDDISGNKLDVTQVTPANQPTYLLSGINNLPSIKFDGSSDILYSTTAPIAVGSNAYTLVAVWKQMALSDSILMEQSLNASTNRSAAIYLDTANLRFTGFGNQTPPLATLVAGQNYINIMVVNNPNTNNVGSYLNSNTVFQSGVTTPSALNLGNSFFSVGARMASVGSYNRYANVYFSEILIFNRNLKPSEITIINNYLSKKYNITVS